MNKFFTIFILPLVFLMGCQSSPLISVKSRESANTDTSKNKHYIQKKTRKELTNYEQQEQGLYKITTDDIYLMNNYKKLVSYKIIKSKKTGQSDLYLPYYQSLKINRSGKVSILEKWKVQVEEMKNGIFIIEGVNSRGEKINQECSTLVECFKFI